MRMHCDFEVTTKRLQQSCLPGAVVREEEDMGVQGSAAEHRQ
jgi:hypothetical protein